ncbi:MAG: fatty acid desaturase [Ignavibacteriae bacterium]|nr:fatty acid desaturase [Ignavibacteriota bacterium]NOG97826.1 fatty acid desaturase [Ignavibacteriota bacterium]
MTNKTRDFSYSNSPEPHKARTRAILKDHPEVRNLIGRNSASFFLILFVVALQIAISFLIKDYPWWSALIAAYFIGAFANHSLFVLIHECAHNLIFKKRTFNILAGILADLPNVVPSSVSFRAYHLKHHSYQGDYNLDADLASRWEAKFIGNSFFGKAFWLLFFPVFQALRPPRLKEIKFASAWTFVNWIAVFGFDVLIIMTFGWTAFLYFVFSFTFSIGLHPLGARWIQEHYLTSPPQETYSYYGPLNIVALNVGYHNEHHDFPSISWNKLPELKKEAPEYYDNLVYHKSWFKLWLKFLFDPKLSLFSRMVRSNKGDEPLTN